MPRSKTVKIRTLDITSELLYERLVKGAAASNMSVRKYGNMILQSVFSKEDFLPKRSPNLKKLATTEELIILHDSKPKKKGQETVRIKVQKNGMIQCLSCPNEKHCEHIEYAIAIPEFSSLIKNSKLRN